MKVNLQKLISDGIEPMYDYALVKMFKTEHITPHGIQLPDNVKDALEVRIVQIVKVGPGGTLPSGEQRTVPIEPGDYALLQPGADCQPLKYAQLAEVKADGGKSQPVEYMLINTYHLTAKVSSEAMVAA